MFKLSIPFLLVSAGLLLGGNVASATHLLAFAAAGHSQATNLGINQQVSPWQELWGKRPPVEAPPRGSRGNLCAIAPVSTNRTATVWNQRPMLIWRGTIGRVEIHLQTQVLWSQPLTAMVNRVAYTGSPLQPGQDYHWLVFDSQSRPIARFPFQVIATDREAIAADLRQLDLRLNRQKASLEEIARKRADYFADRQLWSDVLQEALSVPNPSPALVQFLEAIPERFCQANRRP